MAVAVRLLDMSLRTDFGFSNILFVYSGRRGVHCWVCDENARALTNDARSAIVDYLSAMSGNILCFCSSTIYLIHSSLACFRRWWSWHRGARRRWRRYSQQSLGWDYGAIAPFDEVGLLSVQICRFHLYFFLAQSQCTVLLLLCLMQSRICGTGNRI